MFFYAFVPITIKSGNHRRVISPLPYLKRGRKVNALPKKMFEIIYRINKGYTQVLNIF